MGSIRGTIPKLASKQIFSWSQGVCWERQDSHVCASPSYRAVSQFGWFGQRTLFWHTDCALVFSSWVQSTCFHGGVELFVLRVLVHRELILSGTNSDQFWVSLHCWTELIALLDWAHCIVGLSSLHCWTWLIANKILTRQRICLGYPNLLSVAFATHTITLNIGWRVMWVRKEWPICCVWERSWMCSNDRNYPKKWQVKVFMKSFGWYSIKHSQ